MNRLKRHGGPTLLPALAILGVSAVTLFLSEATWLQMSAAVFLVIGAALGVFAIATPEFLEADHDDPEEGH